MLAETPDSSSPTLEADDLTVRFGSFAALENLTAHFQQGMVNGLIGPNGAGKTTLLNVISGVVKVTSGDLRVLGKSVKGRGAVDLFSCGISRTYQIPRLFKRGTVEDNIIVGLLHSPAERHGIWLPWRPSAALKTARKQAREWCERLGWQQLLGRSVTDLTLPEQRMVELLRAVASEPRVLLLDEPSSGLDTDTVKSMLAAARPILPAETAIILVSHDVPLVLELAQRTVALVAGRCIMEGETSAVASSPEVQRAYLGEGTA